MSSIEELILEIEEYVDNCKPSPFSSTKIIVDKDQLDTLLVELRHRTPEEIKKYQKVVSSKDAILNDAKAQAEKIKADAFKEKELIINEHEIVQEAYDKGNQIIAEARDQAQQILDKAVVEANSVRQSAMEYTDDLLAHAQGVLGQLLDNTKARYESYVGTMSETYNMIVQNRQELNPSSQEEEA